MHTWTVTCRLSGQLCSTDTMNYELEATVMHVNTSLLLHHPSGYNPAQTSPRGLPHYHGHCHYIKILMCVSVCVTEAGSSGGRTTHGSVVIQPLYLLCFVLHANTLEEHVCSKYFSTLIYLPRPVFLA